MSAKEELTPATGKAATKPAVEYSSREVSPPALLVQQLLQAHYIFLLHHSPSLSELFVRLGRDKLCSTLERYWTRYAKTWDVLLHGNPAADVFTGVKLASGGELGFGVGEEAWGSSERDVLEDFVHKTEGMVDMIVSRYGEPATVTPKTSVDPLHEDLPWIGSGSDPVATDGVVFTGVGAISRPSIRNISLWMRQIYTHGDQAYGVRDNPLRERRKRIRHKALEVDEEEDDQQETSTAESPPVPGEGATQQKTDEPKSDITRSVDPTQPSPGARPEAGERIVPEGLSSKESSATPHVAGSANQSLDKATEKASTASARANKSSGTSKPAEVDEGYTMGIPDQYMKYLTFGLSTLAKPSVKERPPPPRRTVTPSASTASHPVKSSTTSPAQRPKTKPPKVEETQLSHVEPMPDGETLRSRVATQIQQENNGQFIIGLKGSLEEALDNDASSLDDGETRTVLRTVQIDVVRPKYQIGDEETLKQSLQRTDAEASYRSSSGGTVSKARLRVLIYVRRPFMYCFLFQDRTTSLTYADFYKKLHTTLAPIHKPLLSSTNVAKLAQLIEASHAQASDTSSLSGSGQDSSTSTSQPIFDLLYDPAPMTLHTTIPNIPEAGTPAAEGLETTFLGLQGWTRVEAINVHSQILNTLASVKSRKEEYERTSKTSRGWWVVWMKVTPSSHAPPVAEPTPNPDEQPQSESDEETHGRSDQTPSSAFTPRMPSTVREAPDMFRTAFLVRKSTDAAAAAVAVKTSTGSRMWNSLSMRSGPTEQESTGGVGAGWGPGALGGGIGVDARKYVESLLSLNR